MTDLIFNFLPGYFSDWLGIPISTNPRVVINVVAVLLLLFLGWYVVQAVRALFRLGLAVRDLEKVRQQKPNDEIVTKDDLQQVFRTAFFTSVWNSFRDTLHEQYDYQGGQKRLVRIRSTVPAETVFSPQSLVDARLNVEFFKHLPGILTGIGIIGTFYGLINGIQHFDPSLLAKAKSDPAQMDKLFIGLKVLFDEVQGAFIASFFAIGTAMLITVLEKVLLNVCYRKLEQLCRMLDALYEGGVGEDYLASLVRSSAENATQTAQLKQSLVTELSELLRDLNAQQIKQSEVLGNLLSAKIQEHIDASEYHGERFRAELKDGLADIGKTVAGVAGGQGETVTGMLEHLIHTFSANIQSTFGDQMKGQAEMMNTAVASMAEMQTGFKTLLQDLRESGKLEREDLTTKVTSLVGTLEAQQGKLESQMTAFIDAIHTQIGASQQETMVQVRESLQEIQGFVGKILTDMEKERTAAVSVEREQQRDFTETSKRLVAEMGVQVGGLVERNKEVVESMGKRVSAQLNDSLTTVHASVSKLLADMEQERRATVDTERDLHRQFTDTSNQLVLDMDKHIRNLVEEIGKTVVALNNNVTALDNTSIAAIKGMDEGAARISLAADHFAKAGNVVSGVMQQAETVSSQLSGSAGSLAQASKALESQLSQYTVTRDALARMVAEMNVMLERAKQEAGVNQQIVEDMRRMVASFGVLKDDIDEFVDSVSKLLAETMAKFRQDMGTHNAEFHKHHADTLNQVASAYEPLAASIGGLTEMISKTRKN
jgi:putative membrane protein